MTYWAVGGLVVSNFSCMPIGKFFLKQEPHTESFHGIKVDFVNPIYTFDFDHKTWIILIITTVTFSFHRNVFQAN